MNCESQLERRLLREGGEKVEEYAKGKRRRRSGMCKGSVSLYALYAHGRTNFWRLDATTCLR